MTVVPGTSTWFVHDLSHTLTSGHDFPSLGHELLRGGVPETQAACLSHTLIQLILLLELLQKR